MYIFLISEHLIDLYYGNKIRLLLCFREMGHLPKTDLQ